MNFLEEALHREAFAVFRHHDLFTLYTSQVLVNRNWVGVRLIPFNGNRREEHSLDLNVGPPGDTLYLVSLYLPEHLRGHGHGEQLYDLTCEFGKAICCKQVVQTPSGCTPRESRRDYLINRGWKPRMKPDRPEPVEVYKDV